MPEITTHTESLPTPTREHWADIDKLEAELLLQAPLVDCPLAHTFTPGLYTRTIFMPAGSLITSKIHRTEHPFVILKGRVSVYIPGVGVEHFQAPYFGITKPGTRRILYIHEDTVWSTFHTNPEDTQDLDAIEDRLIERHELTDGKTAFEFYKQLIADNQVALPEQLDYMGAP